MKKLIPALCMLLVAACLMGTSTYAWFSANEDVKASGMAVKAAADGGLAIGSWKLDTDEVTVVAPEDNEFKTSAEASWKEGNSTIKPTSLNAGTWYSASADENTSHQAAAPEQGKTKYTAVTGAALLGYYQHTKWDVKSLDATGAKYTLKVTSITVDQTNLTTASASLNKALRVAIKVGNEYFVFAPLGTDLSGQVQNNFYHVASVDANEVDTNLKIGTASATAGVTNFGTAIYDNLGTDRLTIEVFVYYEGEDANCKTSNIATNVDTLNVTIAYTAVKNQTQQGG